MPDEWIACAERLSEPRVIVECRSAGHPSREEWQARWTGDWWIAAAKYYGQPPLPTHWRPVRWESA